MKIVFMGSPEFAVPALSALIDSDAHEVIAVYSQPPRESGRGQQEQKTLIHQLAEKTGIEVFTPTSLKSEEEQEKFKNLEADVAVVVAYGLILPKEILQGCKHGCVNIHPSLLPRWRGAAPIQRTIMAGDEQTGVCIVQMDEGLDTGDIIEMELYEIPPGIHAGLLHDVLAEKGSELLLTALEKIENGIVSFTPQVGEEDITYADKISKTEAKIDWQKSARKIECHIRGLYPYPGAFFEFEGERIKILSANIVDIEGTPGEVLDANLTIACGDKSISPVMIQKQGKSPCQIGDFLCGNDIPVGTKLK